MHVRNLAGLMVVILAPNFDDDRMGKMTDVVKTTMAELWRVNLESAVGGSGVNSVDVIIVDRGVRTPWRDK